MKDAIYFIAGPVPTKSEAAEIEKLGIKRIRNASMVKDVDCLEKCSKVAGSVPKKYIGVKGIEVLKKGRAASGGRAKPADEDSLG